MTRLRCRLDTKLCADSNTYGDVLVVCSAIVARKSGTTFCAVGLDQFSVPNPPQKLVGGLWGAIMAGSLRALSVGNAGAQPTTSEAGRLPASSLHARTASSVINALPSPAVLGRGRGGGEGA